MLILPLSLIMIGIGAVIGIYHKDILKLIKKENGAKPEDDQTSLSDNIKIKKTPKIKTKIPGNKPYPNSSHDTEQVVDGRPYVIEDRGGKGVFVNVKLKNRNNF